MPQIYNKKELTDEYTTKLSLGDYTIEFAGWNKKGNPHELIEKLYKLGQDKTMNRDEKNRDLRAIVKEYMNQQ